MVAVVADNKLESDHMQHGKANFDYGKLWKFALFRHVIVEIIIHYSANNRFGNQT